MGLGKDLYAELLPIRVTFYGKTSEFGGFGRVLVVLVPCLLLRGGPLLPKTNLLGNRPCPSSDNLDLTFKQIYISYSPLPFLYCLHSPPLAYSIWLHRRWFRYRDDCFKPLLCDTAYRRLQQLIAADLTATPWSPPRSTFERPKPLKRG